MKDLQSLSKALPEEEVRVTITLVKKSYAVGALEEIVKASAERVEPACPVYKECGGCQLQHLSYKDSWSASVSRCRMRSPESDILI